MAQIHKGGLFQNMWLIKIHGLKKWVFPLCADIIAPQLLYVFDHAYFSPRTENKPPLWIWANVCVFQSL